MSVNTEFLRRVAIFSGLSQGELEEVAALFKERQYKKNDIIFFEEDTGKYMYIVREGRVKVSRLLPSGKEMILAFHEAGEYFGEMALIDGGTSPASVTAVVPTVIYVMSATEFERFLEHPKMNRVLLRTLSGRCRDAWKQIEVLTFHNADARIRTALNLLCKKKGVKTEGGTRIDIHLTHKELADITGISRETATRVLNSLQDAEVLAVRTGHFIVKDPDQLVDDLLFD